MAISFNISVGLTILYALFGVVLPFAPAPAPTSDGTAIDQCIACVLMLLALLLTYIIH